MFKYFAKLLFLSLVLVGSLSASAQTGYNVAKWGGTITVSPLLGSGTIAGMTDGGYTDANVINVTGSTATTRWLQIQFGTAYLLNSYSLTTTSAQRPTAWTFSGSNDGSAWTPLDTRTAQTFTSNTAKNFPLIGVTTAYKYYMISFTTTQNTAAVNICELELYSTTAAPVAPVLAVTAMSGTEAGASWNYSLLATDSFFLERSSDGVSFALVNSFSGTTLSYIDQTLNPSLQFYYRMRAKNPNGYSPYSNVVTVTTNSLTGQSADITNDGGKLYVSAENSGGANAAEGSVHFIDNDFTTKWLVFTTQASGNISAVYKPTGQYVVTGYIFSTAGDANPRDPKSWSFYGSNDSATWIKLDTQVNQMGNSAPRNTSFTYVLPNPGTTSYQFYRWLMTANNGATDGVRLQVAEWQILGIDVNAPSIPTTLAVSSTTTSNVDLSWAETSATTVTGFLLQRGEDGRNFSTIATLPAGTLTYTDNKVYDSTTYYYRVQALGTGTAVSGWSNVASGTTGFVAGIPVGPRDLKVVLSIDSVVGLSWNDRSYNETGFKIQRSTDGLNFSDLKTLAASTVAYNDSAVWPAIRYYYRVFAFNASGNSGLSNVDSTTTPGFNHAPVLAVPQLERNVCSNTAGYAFTLTGLTPGPSNESGQSMTVTSVVFDRPELFASVTFTPPVTAGGFTLNVKGSGTALPGDMATATITVKDNGGTANVGTDSLQFTFPIVFNPLVVTISPDKDTANIIRYQTVHLTAMTNYASTTPDYTWDMADGIESERTGIVLTVRPITTSQTSYTVHATSTSRCTASATVTLKISDPSKVVGNVLTPNGDGINDRWIIWNIEKSPNNSVKVFDRAGRLVFRRDHYANDWDGTYGGRPLAEGLYYYVVDFGDGSSPVKGTLNILNQHN